MRGKNLSTQISKVGHKKNPSSINTKALKTITNETKDSQQKKLLQ